MTQPNANNAFETPIRRALLSLNALGAAMVKASPEMVDHLKTIRHALLRAVDKESLTGSAAITEALRQAVIDFDNAERQGADATKHHLAQARAKHARIIEQAHRGAFNAGA